MGKIGKTLKLLRVSHNLSQREVTKGVMDFSYYNCVENDKVNISYSKLVQLLRKMNISMEEFTFLQEKNQKNDNPHKLIAEAHYSEDINQLKYLKNLYNKKFEISNNWLDRYFFHPMYIFIKFTVRKKIKTGVH